MRQAIAVMIRSNQNLLDMVNTLLEVYRFEAGKKTLGEEPVEIKEIAQEVVSELTPLAAEKNLSLNLDTAKIDQLPGKNAIVTGDPLELRRVLNNLIGNEIKFTDTGGVEIRIFPTPTTSQPGEVVIEVADTGYGIAPEDQTRIFERFRQGKNKRSGSGLGLHLSSRIVEAHNGHIWVESEPQRGSTFYFTIPKADLDHPILYPTNSIQGKSQPNYEAL